MPGFTTHTGRIAVYNADDVDTDRIIPARFLTRVSRSGYGELAFKDVRGPEFPLDQPEAQGATILVVGTNFGCGSSREHAVWAIQQAGFLVVVARAEADSPGYSDIFRQNAANCGLLLVELGREAHEALIRAGTGGEATVDLPGQTVAVGAESHRFEINPVLKDQILAGLDLIGTTLSSEAEIAAFEQEWKSFAPKADTPAPGQASNA
jgi:3-isopropylmalate/(R)-2-methylmalate dehydratase small subunit